MPLRLDTTAADFQARFSAFLLDKRETAVDVSQQVADILAQVQSRGDDAVLEYTRKFDRVDYDIADLRLGSDEIERAMAVVPREQIKALQHAHDRIAAYHQRQLPQNDRFTDDCGIELGHRWTAVAAVGLYVPGGLAAYPSSVLMNAVPAKVAEVPRLAMAVPTPDGTLNPLVLAAAHIAGVDEIYRMGGAQAIAALAYGTATIVAVDKIVGPGNAYVATAKRHVFGTVGIDMIAGPSEILVLADKNNNPSWIAADLLSQAEHDVAAQSILVTDDEIFADQVVAAVAEQLPTLAKGDIATASWDRYGSVIVVQNWDEAVDLVDRIAPEHLAIALNDRDSEAMLERVRNAGSIFLGAHTPEPIGDYIAGPNHVLPTARGARFSSGLSVLDFMKRSSIIRCDAPGLAHLGPDAVILAEAEGLSAHARAISLRLNQSNPKTD
ncbi:MAG: histidinol dehydrogenase [Rhodospirillaceae bacterium]|jgi:histidinol dehydrogenase|nr:histidinol dehydrogenase [Rhodospirillaceae bacterium]MBT4688163.1 histidinol dehydrogenase [Rhodospirillaceae bacterium]MBT5081889.1 histidinol dehydrogenase [Rhodospirillaceae bacterium]MBT5523112.1 histidinol dehydrogenase [Rhodospirillaceae bacterium]MBT5881512.1 histidinol dehydrogenase [Rhodospirillaceae bacterium]